MTRATAKTSTDVGHIDVGQLQTSRTSRSPDAFGRSGPQGSAPQRSAPQGSTPQGSAPRGWAGAASHVTAQSAERYDPVTEKRPGASRLISRWLPVLTSVLIVGLFIASCGGSDDSPADTAAATTAKLSPAAQEGFDVAQRSGCTSCHGPQGQGGVAPPFIGLAGSDVTLADGTTVVADDAYLERSIKEPQAQMVDGYNIQMPTISLSDGDVDKIVTYLDAVGAK